MYKKLVFLWCVMLLALCARTQVTLSVQVPPTGVMQKSQLWNLMLVSTSDIPVRVSIKLSLVSTKDNSPVMTGSTKFFNLPKGAKQISNNDVAPVQYDFPSSMYNIDRDPNGFLPVGNFLACYTVTKMVGENITELAEECVPVEVQPLSPPLLNAPFDQDTLNTVYPQFTWLPPSPLNLFNDLTYDMILVEVLPGESADQAIQQNIPVYNAGNLREPSHIYPASNKSLDTAKTYAWRIVAKNNGQLTAQSEVWKFTIGTEALTNIDSNANYALLHDELGGTYNINNYFLHIKYTSFWKAYNTTVSFTDETGNIIYQEKRKVSQGDNYFDFQLSSRFKTEKVYQISVPGQDNKKHILRFYITKN